MTKNNKAFVSVSTLSDYEDLHSYIKTIEDSGASFVHCDYMDGEFVPKKVLDLKTIEQISNITTLPLDVHVMAKEPSDFIQKLLKLKVNMITVHYEAYEDKFKLLYDLAMLNLTDVIVGLSINPDTKIENIVSFLPHIDLVLLMSVQPGASGQKFMEQTYEKVKAINEIKNKQSLKFLISVDGGINDSIGKKLKEYGADILCISSYFNSAKNKKLAVENLKN